MKVIALTPEMFDALTNREDGGAKARVAAFKLLMEMAPRAFAEAVVQHEPSWDTVQTELPVAKLLDLLRSWTINGQAAVAGKSVPGLEQAVTNLQLIVAELSAQLSASKLNVQQVFFAEDEDDAPHPWLAEPPSEETEMQMHAEFLKMQQGKDFNVEVLFGGIVPTFEQLPRCPTEPCPACDARRDYFANQKVH